jgi:hypothetical protein
MAKVRYPDATDTYGAGRRLEPRIEGDPEDDTPLSCFGDEQSSGGRDTDRSDHLLPLDKLFR